MKLLIINNLASGFGEGAVYDFMRSFIVDGDEIVLRSTDGTSDIRSFLYDAINFDAVVASGGDGTVASVCYGLRETGIPVLAFPAGTANLLAQNLALPIEPHALATIVRNGKTLDFDLGEIEVAGETYGFVIMAGAGYDAAIMHGAKPTKKLLGPMAYLSAAIVNALPQVSRFTIKLDDATIESEGLGILLVNFSKIQFDISITDDNRPRDGAFDIVVLKASTAFELIPTVIARFFDREGQIPSHSDVLDIYHGREIEIIADPPMAVQYDGELINFKTPFKARILKKATRFILSDEGYDLFR